ncbi:MAG: PCRF domain-containing protein, partial [bacterium]
MYDKLVSIEKHYHELSQLLCTPEVIADRDLFQQYSRSLAEISDVVAVFGKHKQIKQQLEEAREILESNP